MARKRERGNGEREQVRGFVRPGFALPPQGGRAAGLEVERRRPGGPHAAGEAHANISITLDTYSHVIPGMGNQTVADMEEIFA
jgi:hypothetical protein